MLQYMINFKPHILKGQTFLNLVKTLFSQLMLVNFICIVWGLISVSTINNLLLYLMVLFRG